MRDTIIVKKGYKVLMEMYSPYRERIYAYNSRIKDSGYYLKPIHVVYKNVNNRRLKYLYFGRYWYRVFKGGKKVKWVYIGKEKPDPHLPDPPISPFEGISIVVENDDLILDERTYNIVNELARRLLRKSISDLCLIIKR